ncbi:hypothetical protein HYW76_03595 [Candidatus Pacearchaeota archaeon]|nr:hypothetical protein [Candidatus Pacearchaeota archaeon]
MDCFIKKIFAKRADEGVHSQFVRFGRGAYSGRAVAVLHKTGKAKLKGSFEYANDFANIASELGNLKFSGIIMSRADLGLAGKNKNGIFIYEVENMDSDKIKEISEKAYCLLLDGEGDGISLKVKKKLPKPGKSGDSKIDDGFCMLETDLKYFDKLKEAFFWDIPDFKKAKVSHEYKINDMVMPQGEKDFEKIRVLTKRKGILVRKLDIDGREEVKEIEFEA